MKCFLFSSNLSDPGGHSYLLTRKILMLIPSIGWSPWKDERICNNENQLRHSEHFFPTSAGFCRGQACHRTYFSVLWTSESPGSNWKTIGLKNIESSKFVDKRERKRVLFNEVYSLFAVFFFVAYWRGLGLTMVSQFFCISSLSGKNTTHVQNGSITKYGRLLRSAEKTENKSWLNWRESWDLKTNRTRRHELECFKILGKKVSQGRNVLLCM